MYHELRKRGTSRAWAADLPPGADRLARAPARCRAAVPDRAPAHLLDRSTEALSGREWVRRADLQSDAGAGPAAAQSDPDPEKPQQRQHADHDDDDLYDALNASVHRQHVDEIKDKDDDEERDKGADEHRHAKIPSMQ
jgi:hypothetical protein